MRVGNSLVVVIPKDWARGQNVNAGDELDVHYNGNVEFSIPQDRDGRRDSDDCRKSKLRVA